MNLPHVCTVLLRVEGTEGGLGGNLPTWSTVATPRCRFDTITPLPATIGISGERVPEVPVVTLQVPVVPHENRIRTTEQGFSGTYEIESAVPCPDGSGRINHYEVELQGVPA